MKKIILSAMILSMAVAVQAQDGQHRPHDRMKRHHDAAIEKLNLSEDQKAKMKSEKDAFRKQMEEMKKNENVTVKDWKSKMESIRKDHKAKIDGILTTEQKSQLEKMKTERKEHMKMGMESRRDHMKQRGDMMKEKLQLTDAQNAQLKKNREEMQTKMKAIREDKSLDDAARKQKMQELMKDQKESFKKVLTEEQKKKLEESRKEHEKHKPVEKTDKTKGTI